MIVEVPYSYEATVLLKGKRKPGTVHVRETVRVAIPEVPGAEAPVAVTFEPAEADTLWRKGRQEYRWHAGSFWRKTGNPDTEESTVTADDPDVVAKGFIWGNPCGVSPDEVAHTYSSGKEQGLAAATARANDRIFVDGILWVRTAEPELYFERRTQRPCVRLAIGLDGDEFRAGSVYPINCLDEMAERFGGGSKGLSLPALEVLLPEAVASTAHERSLAAAAKQLLREVGNGVLGGTREYFDAYADLRDEHAKFELALQGGDQIDAAPLVASVSNAVRTCGEGISRFWLDEAADAMARVERRLEDASALSAMAP